MTHPLTRRGFLVVSGAAVAASALRGSPAGAAGARAVVSTVPTWQASRGYALGSRQASNGEIAGYLKAVAAASDRVRLGVLAHHSLLGQEIPYVVVSHPENLARLAEYQRRTRALRLKPVGLDAAQREVRDMPAFVLLYANVHGNEPSGADAAVQLLYDLAARDDEVNALRLRELIVLILPVQNPDGRDHSRRVNLAAFDLNRDWFTFTQPETIGKLELWAKYPGILGIDVHEQFLSAPDTFYMPPANDPVHHESSHAGLDASNHSYTPAIEQAFQAKGYAFEHYHAYDLFFPGYGDVMPVHAYGAAGVLFEQENNNLYPEKFARQFTAIDAAVTVAAAQRRALLTAWAQQWKPARDEGRQGRMQEQVIQNPDSPPAIPRPEDRVYGYAIRTSRHAADVAHLVQRLRTFDIEVHVLTRATPVGRLRAFGDSTFSPTTLGRGTLVISAGQPMKRFVHVLLADDPDAPVNYFYDVSGWSNPALMALQGGAIGEPIHRLFARPKKLKGRRRRIASLRAVDAAPSLSRAPRRGAGAYAFALDSAFAQVAAFELLRDGVEVGRAAGPLGSLPAGSAVVDGSARTAVEALRVSHGVRPVGLSAAPEGVVALRRPRVAIYDSVGSDATEILFASSRGFAQFLIGRRFGLPTRTVSPAEIELGVLARDVDVLIVPDGLATVIPGGQAVPNVVVAPPGGGLTPLGLANVQAFVTRGGTFVGYRSQGVALALGAGIAGNLATVAAPKDLVIPGLPLPIALLSDDGAVRGLGDRAYAFNVSDPILTGGGTTIARYPSPLRGMGYAAGLAALEGTVAATALSIGRGRSYVLAFDPAYRGWVEGTQRIVGNILLDGPAAGASRAVRVAPRAVSVAGQRDLVVPVRWTRVRVAGADAGALRSVAASLQLAPDASLGDGPDGTFELRAIDRAPLAGQAPPWVCDVIGALQRAGVAPVLVVA